LAVEPLGPPPAELSTEKFPKRYVDPARLVRVSSYTTGEPYFGKSGNNRFDAPGAGVGAPEYGTCYFGTDLEVAMAESILHDEMPVNGKFLLTRSQFDERYALYFAGSALHLLDLSGLLLKRLGGSADLAGTSNYSLSQQWACAVHRNPVRYDGFFYMSRQLNTRRSVALFDRAHDKIQLVSYSPLTSAAGFGKAMQRFAIALI
jgi:hypothetical protein